MRDSNPEIAHYPSDKPLPATVTLRIPEPKRAETPPATPPPSTPKTRPQTIAQLSREYKVSELVLREHNPDIAHYGSDAPLPPNTQIRIPAPAAAAPPNPSIADLARKHQVTEDAIRSSNPAIAHLASDAPLPSGATVTIPPKGPTIAEVAAKNGVAELAIRQANPDIAHLASDAPLPPNTVVRVPSKLEVEKGPTISEVARKYAVTEKEVRDNNPDIAHYPNDRPLPLGLALRVPVPSPQTIGPTPSRPAPAAPIKLQTISDLSWKYGVSEQLIRDSNPELASYPSDKPLPPNTALRIPAGGPSPTPRPEDLVTGSSASSSSPPPPPPRHTAETITTAARRLAVSELVIRQLNPDVAGLASDAPIPAHVVLRGPIPSGAPSRVSGDSSSPALVFASTMGGPSHPPPLSAGTIADIWWKYGVTEQVIRDHNPSIAHYPSDRPLPPNTSIRIPDGVATAPAMNANRPATPIRASDFATGVTTTTTATFVASRPQPPPTLAGAVIEQQQPSPYATSSASSSYGATADARNTTDVLTIASVSWKYGVSERLVRDYNPELADYPSERPIPSGVSLKIPGAAVAAGTAIPTASPSGVTTIHSGGGEEGGRQLRAEDMSTLRSPPTQLTTTSGAAPRAAVATWSRAAARRFRTLPGATV